MKAAQKAIALVRAVVPKERATRLPLDYYNNRPGRVQRADGVFRWSVNDSTGRTLLGSCDRLDDCWRIFRKHGGISTTEPSTVGRSHDCWQVHAEPPVGAP